MQRVVAVAVTVIVITRVITVRVGGIPTGRAQGEERCENNGWKQFETEPVHGAVTGGLPASVS
jgi:hypothetical protein